MTTLWILITKCPVCVVFERDGMGVPGEKLLEVQERSTAGTASRENAKPDY